jgi:hypothetical protein
MTNAVAIPARVRAVNARTRGRDPAETVSVGVTELEVSVAAAAVPEVSISLELLGVSVALSRLASVVAETSVVEEASVAEEAVLAGMASGEEANFSNPPVRVAALYVRVKSEPVSPFVLVVVYFVESSNPNCLLTVHFSITDRLISHTLEYTVPSTVPCTSYTPVSAAPFGSVSLAQGPNSTNAVWYSHAVSLGGLHPRSIYRVPVGSASRTMPLTVRLLSPDQRSDVMRVEGILIRIVCRPKSQERCVGCQRVISTICCL